MAELHSQVLSQRDWDRTGGREKGRVLPPLRRAKVKENLEIIKRVVLNSQTASGVGIRNLVKCLWRIRLALRSR